MADEAPAITCSAQELIYLARVLGSDTLLGVEDPFVGWLADEIEAADVQTRDTLVERRFIQVQGQDGIVMDAGVAALVGACAFPDASFVTSVTVLGGSPAVTHLHVIPHLAVEQRRMADSGGAYRLSLLENAQAVYERIVQLVRLDGQAAVRCSEMGRLPEGLLAQAGEVAAQRGAQAAAVLLQNEGELPETVIAPLAETLAHPALNASLVALKPAGHTWDVTGLGLLEGANGLWCLRLFAREQEHWVELRPCDAEDARLAVRRVMERVLEVGTWNE